MLLGGVTPILSADELEQLGFKIMVDPVATLLATGAAVRKLASTLFQQGRLDSLAPELLTFEDVKQVLGLDELLRTIDNPPA
jgi:methylisocitrate lyase